MVARIIQLLFNKKTFLRGSGILALTTLLSYVFAIWRDRLFATTFGASSVLDAYTASFVVPDLILNIFVAGALTAAFIPLFTRLESKHASNNISTFVSSVLNGALLIVVIAGAIAYAILPYLANILVPGFDDAARTLYVSLARLLLLSPLIFAISNTLGSILVSKERFLFFGLSAPLYNIGIIAGTLWLVPSYGVFGVAYGALIGALLHLMIRVIGVVRYWIASDFRYTLSITFAPLYKKFLRLMTPKMIGHPLEQLTVMGYTIIASSLGAGSIVIFTFARNFQYAPIAIIGINLALAMFPTLSKAAAHDDRSKFVHELKFTSLAILLTTGVAAIVLFLLRFWIIDILLGGGAFNATAIAATASALGWFCLSIPTESLNQLFNRAFYSLHNSKTPVIVGLVGIVIAIGVGYVLSLSMGINGLVLGFFVGSLTRLLLLATLVRIEIVKKF